MRKGEKDLAVISGVGVVVQNSQGQILMKKRQNSHGENEWALPGGKVEFGESFEDCALRELKEETNLNGQKAEVISLSNQRKYLDKRIHCVIIGVRVQIFENCQPQNMEPEKCQELAWFVLDNLPENIFEGSRHVISALRDQGQEIKYIR
jgi:8-oxo-dGTP diphosphatase